MTNLFRSTSTRRVRPITGVFGVLISCGLITLAIACGDDDGANGSSSSSGDTSEAGSSGSSGNFQTDSSPPEAAPPPVCVSQQAAAIESTRPVDIIFVIDNSDSMTARIAEVEQQINQNFAAIIAASGLDYRVVMLSSHGAHTGYVDGGDPIQHICVKAPLSGTTCNPIPAKPAETAQFIHHNILINSTDAWCRILGSFNSADVDGSHPQGWSKYLRQGAFKTFVVITDDKVDTQCNPFGTVEKFDDKSTDPVQGANMAAKFDGLLLALSPGQFGTSAARNYVWHSIVGLEPFDTNDLTKPYPPSADIATAKCSPGSVAPGTGHQGLSKLTGGLRYPVCHLDYTTIFNAMATDVIKRSHVACEYAIPPNPEGGTIDPATAVVRYTSSAKVDADFGQVKDLASCAPDKFYIEGDRIKLCPDSCAKVAADENAQIKILFGCVPKLPGTN